MAARARPLCCRLYIGEKIKILMNTNLRLFLCDLCSGGCDSLCVASCTFFGGGF